MPAAIPPHASNTRIRMALAALLASCLCLPAQAQVAFIVDMAISNACLANNWNTPHMQQWLGQMPHGVRYGLYASLRMDASTRRCLVEQSPLPAALCDKAIAGLVQHQQKGIIGGGPPFLDLSADEKEQLHISPANCPPEKPQDAQWHPADLAPTPAAQAVLRRAQAGELQAQIQAATLFEQGNDVLPDATQAVHWRTQAALQGDVDAQLQVAQGHHLGRDPFERDPQKAIQFYTLAAKQGNADAMWGLFEVLNGDRTSNALVNKLGFGNLGKVPALFWLEQAAAQGHDSATLKLARMLQEASPPHKADPTRAASLLRKAADQGCTECMLRLADALDKGQGTTRNTQAAHQWRRKADSLGENGFTANLSNYWPFEKAFDDDDASHMRRLVPLATQGDVNAQLAVAQRTYFGTGVKKDQDQAVQWWQKTAQAGDPIGQRMYGKLLLMGWEGSNAPTYTNVYGSKKPKPDLDGLAWLQKAAAQNDGQAMSDLAFWYINAPASNRAESKSQQLQAIHWLEQAANAGYRPEDSRSRASHWKSLMDGAQ